MAGGSAELVEHTVARLQGKTALVTGAASGIGLAIAARFATEGAQVVFTDITGDACTRACHEHGGALALELDVALDEAWGDAIPQVMDRFGKLDVLVNNAGIALLGDVETLSVADFDRTMAVDLRGVFLGCKYAVQAMKPARQGSIINMSSISGIRAQAELVAYNAAKAGVALMTKSVALHCGQQGYGIRCNSIHPGLIRTPILDKLLAQSEDPDALLAGFIATHPIGHMGEPADVAALAVYLASDEARFVTGSAMSVDGGAAM